MPKFAKSIPILAFVLLVGCSNTNLATNAAKSPLDKASPASAPTTKAKKSDTLSDTVVIPGVRVGPVTRNTTRQDLAKQFGAAHLKDQPINIGEGATEPGTRVDLGSKRSFSVVWTNSSRTKPKEIRYLGSDWRTLQGIGVGTSLAQLQQKLGTFKLYGFAWDYGGTVVLEGTKLAQYDKKLVLRLRIAPNAAEKSPNDFKAVIGDRLFASTNPHLPPLKPEVGEMIVGF
jgi:hypothetical protein